MFHVPISSASSFSPVYASASAASEAHDQEDYQVNNLSCLSVQDVSPVVRRPVKKCHHCFREWEKLERWFDEDSECDIIIELETCPHNLEVPTTKVVQLMDKLYGFSLGFPSSTPTSTAERPMQKAEHQYKKQKTPKEKVGYSRFLQPLTPQTPLDVDTTDDPDFQSPQNDLSSLHMFRKNAADRLWSDEITEYTMPQIRHFESKKISKKLTYVIETDEEED